MTFVGVEFAAHADLADDDVALLPREIFKPMAVTISNSVGCSKMDSANGLTYSVRAQMSSFEIIWPLTHECVRPEFDDEGRGIKAGLIARGLENRGQHGTGGAFAVRARDVDKFAFAFGVAHGIEQRGDALEAGDAALPADGVDIM